MVESALTGQEYNPYIRRIMWEGVLGSWKKQVNTWFRCAWPLHKDDTLSRSGRPMGLNIYFVLNLFSSC